MSGHDVWQSRVDSVTMSVKAGIEFVPFVVRHGGGAPHARAVRHRSWGLQHIDRCIEVPSAQLGDSACTAGADSRTRSRRVLRAVIVAAVSALALVGVVSAPALAATPHTTYSSETDACTQCHVPHQAVGDNILRDLGGGTGDFNGVTFCYGCHDGTAAVNVKTGLSNASFAGTSGHALEAAAGRGAAQTSPTPVRVATVRTKTPPSGSASRSGR